MTRRLLQFPAAARGGVRVCGGFPQCHLLPQDRKRACSCAGMCDARQTAASHEACEVSPPPPAEELRIILVGRTGTGRSSSGNTILGRSAFGVDVSPSSVTKECVRQSGTVDGRSVAVIDTPGLFHTHLSPQEVMAEVGRCVLLASPGPHVFLVTLQLSRFTQEERDALDWIKAMFGPEATRFTVALFTGGDELRDKCLEDFLEESEELKEFIHSCHGGYHLFDNKGQDEASLRSLQVVQLLKKVDKIVTDNGGGCYSNQMFEEAERAIQNTQERILAERRHKIQPLATEAEDKGVEGRRKEEDELRRRAERLFWCELVTAMGRGAAEGAGIMEKEGATDKSVKKVKVVQKAAALVTSPLSISSAARAVGGAVREGSKVFYKHRKTFLR